MNKKISARIMPKCTISYDNNSNGIYYSGQTLSGDICFINDVSRKAYAITLKFLGFAKCEWPETFRSGGEMHYFYTGKERYIHDNMYLLGAENEFNEFELPVGMVQKYHFSYPLSQNLPTSIEVKHGYCHIRYMIIFEVQCKSELNMKYEFPLTIIKNVDLNFKPEVKTPVKVELDSTFLFSSKVLHMTAATPITGFVSGQTAKVHIDVNNLTNNEVIEILVEIMRIIRYTSTFPKEKSTFGFDCVKSTKYQGVQEKGKKSFTAFITVPAIAPSSESSCKIMEISYELSITAKVGGFAGLTKSPTLAIPIVIGTVPILTPQGVGWNLGASSSSSARTPLPSAPPVPSTPEDYDIAPPSYIEAITIRGNSQNNRDEASTSGTNELSFNPRYPVYNITKHKELPPKYEDIQN